MPSHDTQMLEITDMPDVIPVVMYTEKPSPEVVMEMHDPGTFSDVQEEIPEIVEPVDIQIVVDELPGAAALDPELEKKLEVKDEDDVADQAQADSKKSKKDPKWDWEAKGAQGFIHWVKERIDDVPKHSGYDSAGIERAISYLEKLDGEISRAMRLDLDGQLDANKIEEVRAEIDNGIERLYARLDKIKSKKGKRKKKAESETGLVKEAQKATNISGIVITVPLLISRIARVCINGMVSGGHDIEQMASDQIKKYDLDTREKAELFQLLADMGYPLRQDRGFIPDEDDFDQVSPDLYDFNSNYPG